MILNILTSPCHVADNSQQHPQQLSEFIFGQSTYRYDACSVYLPALPNRQCKDIWKENRERQNGFMTSNKKLEFWYNYALWKPTGQLKCWQNGVLIYQTWLGIAEPRKFDNLLCLVYENSETSIKSPMVHLLLFHEKIRVQRASVCHTTPNSRDHFFLKSFPAFPKTWAFLWGGFIEKNPIPSILGSRPIPKQQHLDPRFACRDGEVAFFHPTQSTVTSSTSHRASNIHDTRSWASSWVSNNIVRFCTKQHLTHESFWIDAPA